MATLQAIRQKMASAEELQSVVKTMKGLAAANIWQYEQAVEALTDYMQTIELGLQIVLQNRSAQLEIAQPPQNDSLGAIIFGSDQGMCGHFNEQVVNYALDQMARLQPTAAPRRLISLGIRVTATLENAGQPLEKSFMMPGSIEGVTPTVQQIVVHLENWRHQQQLGRVVLFHNAPLSGSSYEPQLVHLLPLDLQWLHRLQDKAWQSRTLPTFTMEWPTLLASLIRQYLFTTIYQAIVESLASENASRLASMQAAEKNIDERLEMFTNQYHHERQRSITEELLDVAAGFEALT